ncbi:MAG: ABC transporter substrate-binding protein [Clostridiales bacterium]|nr:ABC transporter substrate-binding protein [Clostridiales bacterium]MCF8022269.1 ABC transporter substrate-binding protein [Clostridiales bacterium]
MILQKKYILLLLALLLIGSGITIQIIQRPHPYYITLAQTRMSADMIPHYIAKQNNYFKQNNVDINIKTCSNKTMEQVLAEGESDIAVMELANFLQAMHKHPEWTAFAPATARKSSFILTKEKIEGFEWKDMKNKAIIGQPPGSTAGVLLEAALRENELAPYRSVAVFYNIPQDLHVGAFKTGCSTYLQAPGTAASRLKTEGTAHIATSLTKEKLPAYIYVTSSKFLSNYSEAVQGFTNSIYKSFLFIKHNPDSIKDYVDIDIHVINNYCQYKIWPTEPIIKEEEVQNFMDMMVQAGELSSPININCINNKFAVKSMKNVKYKPEQ